MNLQICMDCYLLFYHPFQKIDEYETPLQLTMTRLNFRLKKTDVLHINLLLMIEKLYKILKIYIKYIMRWENEQPTRAEQEDYIMIVISCCIIVTSSAPP